MKSTGASNLLKQKGMKSMNEKARRLAAIRDSDSLEKSSITEYIDIEKLQQDTTDYRSKPLLETLPLNARSRFTTSRWPVPNRDIFPKVMQPSRNMGTIWRRYANGQIDLGWAYGKLSDAINKHALNIALSENDALAIASIFPNKIRFPNLPKSIVNIKATLSETERQALQDMVSKRMLQDLFGNKNNNS